MVLFGYPVARENDAERAARAALSIQRALADLNGKNAGAGKPELVARVGLETVWGANRSHVRAMRSDSSGFAPLP